MIPPRLSGSIIYSKIRFDSQYILSCPSQCIIIITVHVNVIFVITVMPRFNAGFGARFEYLRVIDAALNRITNSFMRTPQNTILP